MAVTDIASSSAVHVFVVASDIVLDGEGLVIGSATQVGPFCVWPFSCAKQLSYVFFEFPDVVEGTWHSSGNGNHSR